MDRTIRSTIPLASFGRVLYAASLVTLGVMGFRQKDFGLVWTAVPQALAVRPAVLSLCAALSLVAGVGLLWPRVAVTAARALVVAFALWIVFFRVPLVFRAPTSPGAWWACGETAAMLAGAWVLSGDRGLAIARVLYGLGLVAFGVGHFTFLERTAGMVPGWLPGHVGWAYFTGGAMIAAGVAILARVIPRTAAMLAAVELTLFTVLVWVPTLFPHPSADQWNEFVDSCVLTGVAWIVAESYGAASARPRVAGPRGR